MTFRYLLLLFTITLSLADKGYSQKLTQFSTDTTKFTTDLGKYFMENSANRDKAADYIKNFEKLWKNNVIAGYFKDVIMETSNTMYARRMKPHPFFYGYINTVINALASGQTGEPFENWQACVDKILKGKSIRGVQDFLDMSENIFKNNTFYKTPTYRYYSLEPAFFFEYDSLPVVRFENMTLIGANPRGDSIAIEETEGIFYPTNGKFYGRGGKVSWARTGLEDDVYATLKRYEIDCKTGNYSSDSAVFKGRQYFDRDQLGRVSDRIITENKEDSYPRFESYSKRLTVKNIYPDVDFEGGFSMRGSKFVGAGSAGNPAKIVFNREGKKFLEISARAFGMGRDKIAANPGAVKFYLGKDSIWHQGLSFTYQVDQRLVTILRGDDGLQKSPFLNTFHNYDMYFEQIVWNIDDPLVKFNFLPNNLQGEAFFESLDFYNRDKEEIIKVGERISPIVRMIDFYNANNKPQSFTVVDFAKHIKYLANDLRPIIFKMAIYGLIYYDPQSDLITVRERLFNYADNAKHKHDYDMITLHSVVPGRDNATMNLLNFDITLFGVKRVLLSDTQKVWMFPKNGTILLKKNRNMHFSGTVASGKFEFVGKDFVFDYEAFKLNMATIDSLKIYVESREPDINGNYPFRKVQTVIENLNGELRIDAPKNKSGWGKAPTFPSFKSFKESYAFYDKRNIFKGVYNRDRFYFQLDPFSIDSLDNFRNEGLRFEGNFVSADIFPQFRETLTLQKDYSLGFTRPAPPGGYNIYKGKANFDQEIRLSNKGLRGGGDLKFSSSISKVPDLIFFPDSANGVASTYDVKEGTNPEFPVVHGDTVRLHFLPYQDLLEAYDIKRPFKSYKENVIFKGRLDLTFKDLSGSGTVEFEKASMASRNILFTRRKMFSDTANFKLKAFEEEGLTFSTVNVNAKIDFDERVGEFVTNGEGSYVKFDKNQYIAYMERFKWYMDAEDIELGDTQKKLVTNPEEESGLDLEGPEFISVHPKQDSLRFYAPGAKYNLRKYIIQCKNVPFIDVADARIFPHNGDVTIFKNAVMDTLRKSTILANTVTKYHTIRNTTASVYSRRNYLASGEYQYLDENDKPYLITFATIRPDTSGQTISEGAIPEKENFKFNDYFSFAGKVFLQATQEFLTFDGGTKIEHNCNRVGRSYLRFTGEINPKDIQIPIPEKAIDMAGAAVGTGLFYHLDSNNVYASFLSLQGARSSKPVIESSGILSYDRENKVYEISNREKLEEMSLPGNYVSLGTEDCVLRSEGRYTISNELGQIKLTTIGNSRFNSVHDSVQFNVMMILDFYFDNGILKKMAKDLELYLGSLSPTPFEGDLFNHGMIELLGKERGDRALSELNLYGSYRKFPEELDKSLVLNDINLTYNPRARAYISEGMIGVGNIHKNEVFRYMDGVIQIKKQRGGDVLDIYLEADANTWYYFTYTRGTMLAASSNDDFNKSISELKGKNKKMKVEKGPSYRFDVTNKRRKDLFLMKMKQMGIMGSDDRPEEYEE